MDKSFLGKKDVKMFDSSLLCIPQGILRCESQQGGILPINSTPVRA